MLFRSNFAANNPVLGGRLHLSGRNWADTYREMLDRMLTAMVRDQERFVAALGARQHRRMLLCMRAARAPWPVSWLLIGCSWFV